MFLTEPNDTAAGIPLKAHIAELRRRRKPPARLYDENADGVNVEFKSFPCPQAKYSVNQHPISIVLAWIDPGEIAIPEIQRPFVRHQTQVGEITSPK